mmetsp:Transcript_79249/g.96914  ORF Transcript_79249/g.96914 Transcript_79249/m.96914 type:complete len:212 (-) Transcript_79249:11-646(-)
MKVSRTRMVTPADRATRSRSCGDTMPSTTRISVSHANSFKRRSATFKFASGPYRRTSCVVRSMCTLQPLCSWIYWMAASEVVCVRVRISSAQTGAETGRRWPMRVSKCCRRSAMDFSVPRTCRQALVRSNFNTVSVCCFRSRRRRRPRPLKLVSNSSFKGISQAMSRVAICRTTYSLWKLLWKLVPSFSTKKIGTGAGADNRDELILSGGS